MDIEIRQDELLEEIQNRFPNHLRICIQAIQIKKLSALLEKETPGEELPFEVVEDAEVPG